MNFKFLQIIFQNIKKNMGENGVIFKAATSQHQALELACTSLGLHVTRNQYEYTVEYNWKDRYLWVVTVTGEESEPFYFQ